MRDKTHKPGMTRLGRLNILWSLIAVAVVVVGLFVTRFVVDSGSLDIASMMGMDRPHWIGFPLTVFIFTALAFVGMPQWVLIGAAVVVFGPVLGGAISWVATLVSALLGFAVGRTMGGARLRARLGERAGRWVDRVSEEGVMAALLVRLLPVAPFVLINMAAGASTMKARDFAVGTAIGIVPKIAAIAVFGRGLVELLRGDNFLLGVGLVFVGILIAVFVWRLRRRHRLSARDAPATGVEKPTPNEQSP